MAKKAKATVGELTYEKAFAELEEVVHKLEEGELSLDESLALFERGQALAARCSQLLDEADLKVKQLVPAGDGYVEQDFALGDEE